jgi:isopenicillin N synthase-like dioxygenase
VSGNNDTATVRTIGSACRDVGFIYIKNHGFPQSLIDNLLVAAGEFFSRSMVDKNKVVVNERLRGYLPLRYRSYEGESKAATSNQEGFWMSEERPINPENRLDGPNLWPENSEALKAALQAYYVASTELSLVLQRAFSLALGESEDYFQKLFTRQSSMLKLNHYPPQENPIEVSNIGVVPHTDSGGFTILWQDDNGGLEIQSKSGEWVLAPPIPVKPLMGEKLTGGEEQNFESYQLGKWRRSFPIAGVPEV